MVPVSLEAFRAPLTLPFIHLTAFSTHIAGGNPAAVVLVTREQDALLSTSERQAIAANFHQPMTAFIVPREIDEVVPTGTLAFDARYFTASIEPGLCGHATLAAAAALFADRARVPDNVDTLYFHARTGVIVARKAEEGRIESALSAGRHEPLPA